MVLGKNVTHETQKRFSKPHKILYLSFRASQVYNIQVSQEERAKLREDVPYVKLYRYNPKHLYPKLNGYGDNGKRSLKL